MMEHKRELFEDSTFKFEDEIDDEDELDLVKLVSNNSNDLNQYLIFKGSNHEWYAMNVSKIEEIVVYNKDIEVVHNSDKDSMIYATADIRESMTTLIYFDDWFGNKRLSDDEYELIILANYGGHKLGIIVKEVANISTIEAKNMSDNSQNNTKTTFVSKVSIEGETHMCTVFDGDKILLDIFDNEEKQDNKSYSQEIRDKMSNKMIFFADDSKFVRTLVEKLFISLGVEYKIFNDGLYLIEYLESHPNCEIDLFITDLEMPNMGGREVIAQIKNNSFYKNIHILVHTNMSNSVMEEELIESGASGVIGKVNMDRLSAAIIKEIR